MRYRKKPIEVQATPVEFVLAVSKLDDTVLPDWIREAVQRRDLRVYEECVIVNTLEGNMRGEKEDWLIQGPVGKIYPCKPDAFFKSFEQVEE